MGRRRAARPPGPYLRELSVNFAQLEPPWKTPSERAGALMGLGPLDPDRQRALEEMLEQASRDGIDPDRLCEALCTGILDYYGELTKSRSSATLRELRSRTGKLRRKVLPLLGEVWRVAAPDHEVRSLAWHLAVSLKRSDDSDWTWFAKAEKTWGRRQSGNPFERAVGRTRQRLTEVGVCHYDDQTDWLRAVRLINPPKELLPPSRPVKISFAPWWLELMQQARPPVVSSLSRKKLKK